MKALQGYVAPLLFMGLLFSSSSFGSSDQKEVCCTYINIYVHYHDDYMLLMYKP